MLNVVPKEGLRAPLFFPVISLLVLSTVTAGAQNVEVSALETCAGLETDALKLACFEAIVAQRSTSVSKPEDTQPRPTTQVEVDTSADIETSIETETPVAIEAELPEAAAPIKVAPTTNEQSPRVDARTTQTAPQADEVSTETFTATVVKVTQSYNRALNFHLANGQVWRQIEPRFLQYPKSREFEIEVRRGILNAYSMRIEKNGRMIKVRQIQ